MKLKISSLAANANVAHLSYAGDPITGDNCNLGTIAIIVNLWHEWKNIKCMVKKGGRIERDTGRQKLGVITGDNCKTGIHISFCSGVKISAGCMTLLGEAVKRDLIKNNF